MIPSEYVSISFALAGRGFALLHFFVPFGKFLSKDEAHYYAEPVGRNTNRIGAIICRTPRFLPQVSVHAPRSSATEAYARNEEHTHEPAMLPSCENALTNASATARFDGGRAKVLEVHAKKQMKPAYDCAIRKLTRMPKCRAVSSKLKPRNVQSKIASCKPHGRDRDYETDYSNEQRDNDVEKAFSSPIGMPKTPRSSIPAPRECVATHLLTANAAIVAKIHGGAQSNKVTVGEYPSVAVRVGKNALNDNETTRLVSASANQYTLQSPNASKKPVKRDPLRSVSSSSLTPTSSSIRSWASRTSSGERKP
jgi:hypothetical protein